MDSALLIKIGRIIPMLGADTDPQRLAALAAIQRLLKANDLTFTDAGQTFLTFVTDVLKVKEPPAIPAGAAAKPATSPSKGWHTPSPPSPPPQPRPYPSASLTRDWTVADFQEWWDWNRPNHTYPSQSWWTADHWRQFFSGTIPQRPVPPRPPEATTRNWSARAWTSWWTNNRACAPWHISNPSESWWTGADWDDFIYRSIRPVRPNPATGTRYSQSAYKSAKTKDLSLDDL